MQTRIIKKSRVQVEEGAPSRRVDRSRARSTCTKSARLLEEDGLVRAVELTCSCGETTVLELEYETDPGPEPQS